MASPIFPIRRVVLFKHGIGYLEREGKVEGDATVALTHIGDSWLYRGGLAAVSLPSSALIVGLTGRTALSRVVAWAPLVAIGKVSYGLYLFHWPIFLALTPQRVGADGFALLGVRMVATGALTVVSYRWLEQPIRRRRALPSTRVARVAMCASAVSLLVAGVVAVPAPHFTPTEKLLALGTQPVIEFPQASVPPATTTSARPDRIMCTA